MIKYEIKKGYEEVSWKDRKKIMPGITVDTDGDKEPELIAEFDTLEEARKELKKYESSIWLLSGGAGAYYGIEEYYIEENEYEEDGEWVDGGSIWEFSKMDLSKIAD